jgi:hypothetical protein
VLSLTVAVLSLMAAAPPALDEAAMRARAWGSRTALAIHSSLTAASPAVFLAEARAVSNWRMEAIQDLQPTSLSALAVLLDAERPVVTRCVKLNNYWCIKRARWNGELGADEEGHTGFASAEHGAAAAVMLLRRYYVDYDRKSALDIVRRWAPAECRIVAASSSSSTPAAPSVLAVRGIQNTLRARWLASRRAKPLRTRIASSEKLAPIATKPAPSRVSAVPLPPLPTVRLPSIMAGVGAIKNSLTTATAPRPALKRQPVPVAAATPAVAAPAPTRPAPRPSSCAPDEQRIQNYAGKMAGALGLQPNDDLKLFDAEGRALPNLSSVLLAMSAFELGYLRASADLVEAAIARLTPRPAERD